MNTSSSKTNDLTIKSCTCAEPGKGTNLSCLYCHPDQGLVKAIIGDLLSKITRGLKAATRVDDVKK